jgi:hypothetical protein
MTEPLPYFRDAWIAILVANIVFLISALIVSVETVHDIVRVALWSIGIFGFSTSTLAWIVAGVNVRLGLKSLLDREA